jgi:hypothetical protein
MLLENLQKKLLDFFDLGMLQLFDFARALPIKWFLLIETRQLVSQDRTCKVHHS